MICQECGAEFDERQGEVACALCCSRSRCSMVKCPNCGMEMPREPHFFAHLRQIFLGQSKTKLQPAPDGLCRRSNPTLAEVPPGKNALVERFLDPVHVRKFLSLGILPGTSLTVLKQSPAVVVRVGYSEFALDRALAQSVVVRQL